MLRYFFKNIQCISIKFYGTNLRLKSLITNSNKKALADLAKAYILNVKS